MTSISQRIINARRQYMFDAAKRWQLLVQKRRDHFEKYQTTVSDLVETPERAAKFRSREALREKHIARLKAAGKTHASSIPAIGTLVQFNEDGERIGQIGNCILLPNSTILTNNHLISSIDDARSVGVEFDSLDRSTQGKVNFMIDPALLFISDQELDMTLVTINSMSVEGVGVEQLNAGTLIEEIGKVRLGDTLNLIQRGGRDVESYEGEHTCLDLLGEGKFVYTTNARYIRPGAGIFNKHWELVAMHQCGVPLVEKGRIISDSSIGSTSVHENNGFVHVGEQGIRVSSILGYLKGIRMMHTDKQELLNAFLDKCKDPLKQAVTEIPSMLVGEVGVKQELPSQLHLHGDIHISIGSQGTGPLASLIHDHLPVVDETRTEGSVFDRDYASRAGFDTEFLSGFSIPEPAASSDLLPQLVHDQDGEEMIFDYHHFSLALEQSRKMPIWGACNVEYTRALRGEEVFDASSMERLKDPRMKDTDQLNADGLKHARYAVLELPLFGTDQIVWGNDQRTRQQAFVDHMHWSNTYLAHQSLKNAMDRGIWNRVERHLVNNLCADHPRATVFAGPLFDSTDPSIEIGGERIQVPLRAWKVVILKDQTAKGVDLRVYGFMYDVSGPLLDLSMDRLDMHRYKTYQAQLSDITERSGVIFPDIVMTGDIMKSLSLGRRGRVVIEKLNDIVLRKRLRHDQLNSSLA